MDLSASRRRGAPGLALAAVTLALLAPAAEAASLSSGRAVTPRPAAAATTSAPRGMSLEFIGRTAQVVGPGALIEVRCVGTTGAGCAGSLSIEAPGDPPEVAYSIDRGEKRTLVVPLGEQRGIFGGMVAVRTRVAAETVQLEGGSVRTARVLRFK